MKIRLKTTMTRDGGGYWTVGNILDTAAGDCSEADAKRLVDTNQAEEYVERKQPAKAAKPAAKPKAAAKAKAPEKTDG